VALLVAGDVFVLRRPIAVLKDSRVVFRPQTAEDEVTSPNRAGLFDETDVFGLRESRVQFLGIYCAHIILILIEDDSAERTGT
jgi:hypothetical protein